jgi:UDP:flavonoid glycosyltransferase YjiC (YdhE family)
MGSVHEALNYGVPMVLFPQMIEQSIVARQIASLGAGLQLTSISGATSLTSDMCVSADRIREAVDDVMRTPRFAQNAARLGREFPTNSPAAFADIVERCVTRWPAAPRTIRCGL